MAGLFAFIERYPNAPVLITKYVEVLFNATILLGILYAIFSVWSVITADLNAANEEALAILSAKRSACAKEYVENRCGSDLRVPAMETTCNNWELCMQQDPNGVRRAKVGMETYADIINGFVDGLSLKTVVSTRKYC